LFTSAIGYGLYQSDEGVGYFMVGNLPTVLQEISEIKISKEVFGLKKIEFTEKNIVAKFYFNSPFAFPVKIEDILIQGESKKSNVKFELKLEKEVTIQPYENSTLTLKGNLPSKLGNEEIELKGAKIIMEILGITIEIQEGGAG
jgi:hypothetical protein